MAKKQRRTKRKSIARRQTMQLSDDAQTAVNGVTDKTGYSASKAASLLAEAGAAAIRGDAKRVTAYQSFLAALAEKYKVRTQLEQRLRVQQKAVTEAHRQITTGRATPLQAIAAAAKPLTKPRNFA